MGTHANQRYVVFSKPFPAELTDVEFTAGCAHLGVPRVPDMGVMRPDNGLG